jgi:hypothetical protein
MMVGALLGLAGAIYGLLGALHALYTFLDMRDPRRIVPDDPAVISAMENSKIRLTRGESTMWQGWVGFNLSHSLGAILFGLVVVLIGRSSASFEAQAGVFLPLAVLVSAAYLVIGVRYWFRTPIVGISLASVCFVASWVLFAKAG